MALAERLRRAIEQLRLLAGDQRIVVTASIGVATRDTGRTTVKQMQQEADQAMYRAKALGRNRVSTLTATGAPVPSPQKALN